MIFANYLRYGERCRILKLRPVHQEYLLSLRDRGLLVAAGSFADDVGGLYLYQTDSLNAAGKLAAEDPYILGDAIEYYSITPWEVHAVIRRFCA
jgi:uncharacterized protein